MQNIFLNIFVIYSLYRENEKTLILLTTPEYYLKFCQACKLAVVSVPEDDKVLLLLPHALEPVHLPHPAVGDPLEDELGCKFIPRQGHLGFLLSFLFYGGTETGVWRAAVEKGKLACVTGQTQ